MPTGIGNLFDLGVRQHKAVEGDLLLCKFCRLAQGGKLFQGFEFIVGPFQTVVVQAVGVDKPDMGCAGPFVFQPEDEIRVETAAVKVAR